MTALLKSTLGAHPAMVPSSVAKMKMLLPVLPFSVTLKPPPPLKTTPVGVPPVGLPVGEGMFTPCEGFVVRGIFTPWPVYKVETPALLSETQNGEVGP